MKHCIKHLQLKQLANLGLTANWSQFNAMPASITSDREPGEGLS